MREQWRAGCALCRFVQASACQCHCITGRVQAQALYRARQHARCARLSGIFALPDLRAALAPEVGQRIGQQRVLRFEQFPLQRFLVVVGVQRRDRPEQRRVVIGQVAQVLQDVACAGIAAHQRIVVAQQANACLQHVVVQIGIDHVQRVQCVQRMTVTLRVAIQRRHAQAEEDQPRQQHGAEDRRPPHGAGAVNCRPWCLPVNVCRNAAMSATSAGLSVTPSCAVPMALIAWGRVVALPSWK